MKTNTQLQLVIWSMTYTEVGHVTEQIEGHACNLACVSIAISNGATADHHIGISYSFHLKHVKTLINKRF